MNVGIAFAEISARTKALDADRVRLTWPNGYRKSGVVSTRTIGPPPQPLHGGQLLSGACEGGVKVEQMGSNGHYGVLR